MSEQQMITCHTCSGNGGKQETETGQNGAQITVWRQCTTCNGAREVPQ